ncbi:hypothetical protein CS542_02095 [Pedobacter sp. IW39]|nr:hypothetical protein CS542_02095 [Pedobacter sp. IW39]
MSIILEVRICFQISDTKIKISSICVRILSAPTFGWFCVCKVNGSNTAVHHHKWYTIDSNKIPG